VQSTSYKNAGHHLVELRPGDKGNRTPHRRERPDRVEWLWARDGDNGRGAVVVIFLAPTYKIRSGSARDDLRGCITDW